MPRSGFKGSGALPLIAVVLLLGSGMVSILFPVSHSQVLVAGWIALALGGALAAFLLLRRTLLQDSSFEWYIAWRYLRDQGRKRSWSTLIVGGILALIAGGVLGASYYWGPIKIEDIVLAPSATQRILQIIALGTGLLAYLVIFLGLLLLSFSLFTSISIVGVFLGTCALVVVLSVMGGFEWDLRRKILGTTSHVVVTKPKHMFTEYRKIQQQIARLDRVKALSPYLESEVMVTSQTNLSGVLIKGIDPKQIGRVTELPKYLKAEGASGKLEDLLHPERLAKIPEARFRPMVTQPMGDPPSAENKDPGAMSEDDKLDAGGAGSLLRHVDGGDPGHQEHSLAKDLKRAEAELKVEIAKELEAQKKLEDLRQKAAQLIAQIHSKDPSQPIVLKDAEEKEGVRSDGTKVWSTLQDVEGEIGKKIPPRSIFPGIIVGAELAKNLRLYVGDDVNVVAPLGGMSPAGPIPKSRPFRVAGIFYSGMYEYDTKYAYVTIPEAQKFLGLGDEVSGIELKVANLEFATPLALEIKKMLQGRGFEVQDWKDMNRNLFSALTLEKVVMFIVLIVIVLVAAFSIITNLIMVVLEKSREISALKTMGASNWSVLKIFFFAGLYIGTIGMLVGVLTGVGLCLFLVMVGLPLDPEVYYISELPVRMDLVDIFIVSLIGIGLSFLATIYPSLMASNLKPVEGLRRYEG